MDLLKDLMGIHERAEEILACACDCSFITTWIFDCDWRWIIGCSIYLHIVLKKDDAP